MLDGEVGRQYYYFFPILFILNLQANVIPLLEIFLKCSVSLKYQTGWHKK